MEAISTFLYQYGMPITLIAVIGIAILGVLKYCKLFTKIDEKYRHYIYIGISVGLSVIGCGIYLAVVGQFEWNYMILLAGAIWALNQTFYNIFKVTPINELCVKLLDLIMKLFNKKQEEEETKPQVPESVPEKEREDTEIEAE